MPQGPVITDEVKMLITKLHKEHPKWTNNEIRNMVLSTVQKDNKSLPKGWPSKFAIDRIMPGVRERVRLAKLNLDPRDRPWTIQSVIRYPIPSEALPAVLQVWFFAQDNGHTVTIRHAQWAARLYAAIKDIEALYGYSRIMAFQEKLAELAGIEDFRASQLDNLSVFSIVTGHIITHDEWIRASGQSEEEWRRSQ